MSGYQNKPADRLIFPQRSGDYPQGNGECMERGCNIRHSPVAPHSHITRWALRPDRSVHREPQLQVGNLQWNSKCLVTGGKAQSHIFKRRLPVRWPVVVVQSASGPRLRRPRLAHKPAASKESPADHQGRRQLAEVGRCSSGAGLRSALELRCSSWGLFR